MGRPDRIIKQHLRTRFVVTLKSGLTFNGLLIDADSRTVTVADASVINADGSSTPADGQVFLPRADVAYMQRA